MHYQTQVMGSPSEVRAFCLRNKKLTLLRLLNVQRYGLTLTDSLLRRSCTWVVEVVRPSTRDSSLESRERK